MLEHSHELHEGHLHSDGLSVFSVMEHSLIDTLPMIPILIITFIVIEYMEHRFSSSLQEKVRNAGVLGPIIGALIGIIPQCGFSIMAVAFYSKRIISLGTMMAIFIATSDEAIPVLLSMDASRSSILPFIAAKIIIAVVFGYIIDMVVSRVNMRSETALTKEFEEDACKCTDEKVIKFTNVLVHSLERTLKVTIYIYILTFLLSLVIEYFGVDALAGSRFSNPYGQIVISSLIGLIPNCAISVGLVKLYAVNAIGFSSVIAGLSSNAGLALIFLFRGNKKRAFIITYILLGISLFSGVIIQVFTNLY